MNNDWMTDARKIPDDVMNYLRRIAVHAVIDEHHNPDIVASVLNISRSALYRWLDWYRRDGDQALDTRKAPGAAPVITSKLEQWLKHTILNSTPSDYGYDTELWTLNILTDLLRRRFGISVYESTLWNHLHRLHLSCQLPQYRALADNEAETKRYLTEKWPIIRRVAKKMQADIFFEDEAGVGILTRSGRTWGQVNSTPIVRASDRRDGYNVLSAITANPPKLYYAIEEKSVSSDQYIAFLEKILMVHPRPIVLVVDHATFHRSKKVRAFVRAHRHRLRVFFLPKHAPEFNPDEQVWNEIKYRNLEREPVINKADLKSRLQSNLMQLKLDTQRLLSFFHLPSTKYVLDSIPM
jgi:transposase